MCFFRPKPVKTEVAKSMHTQYFNELSNNEIRTLIENKFRSRDIRKVFLRPDFCMYEKALHNRVDGCAYLTDMSTDGLRTQICPQFCREHGCQFVSENPDYFDKRILCGYKPKHFPNLSLLYQD